MDNNQPGVQLIESEEDKKKKSQPTQLGSAFAPSGPAKASPAPVQQARAEQAAGPTRGTGFTGVGRFLQANVGSRLGQQVAGRVSQAGQEAASRLGQAVGQFQQQRGQQQQQLTQQQQAAQAALQRISAGGQQQEEVLPSKDQVSSVELTPFQKEFETRPIRYGIVESPSIRYGTGFDDSLAKKFNKWQSKIKREEMPSEEDFLSSLTPDEVSQYKSKYPEGFFYARKPGTKREKISAPPVDLAPSQEEIAAYQAVAGGNIGLSGQLQDVAGIQSQAKLASQLARGTQTAAGRKGLLQQVVGRGPGQYTAGQSALDALILGQSGGQLAAARRASAGLGRQVGTQERLAAEQARQFGTEAQRAKEQLTGERGAFISDLLSKGEAQKSLYGEQQSKFLERAKKEIESGEPISRDVAEAIFGPDVDRISTMGFSKQEIANLLESGELASLQTSLSPQQAAQIEALKRLGSETGIYKSPEELAQLAGKTTGGATTLGTGFKFDPSGKYTEKQKEFETQKKIIDEMLEQFRTTDKAAIRPGGQMAPLSYQTFAKQLDDYLYGKELPPQGPIRRIEGPRQQTADLDAISMLETARGGPFALQEKPAWVGEDMRSSYDALRDALLKLQKLNLTGEQIKIKPKSEQ